MKPEALPDLRAAFEELDGSRRRTVQLALCRHALGIWDAHIRRHGPVEYVDLVVGLYHCGDSALPRDALTSVAAGEDRAGVAKRYQEPIAALQDDDLTSWYAGDSSLGLYLTLNERAPRVGRLR